MVLASPFYGIFWGFMSFGYLLIDRIDIQYILALRGTPFEDPNIYAYILAA